MVCVMSEMSYVSLMVTTKQRPRTDAQKIRRKETERTTTENRQLTKASRNRGRNNGITKRRGNDEIALVSHSKNKQIQSTHPTAQSEWKNKKTRPDYMLPPRDSLSFRDTHELKGMARKRCLVQAGT